jgi:dihydrofolate synthase / folylpolyglutamate synthase
MTITQELTLVINELMAPATNHEFTTFKHLAMQLFPSLPYPIVLIGGTNGKGSVCAYLSSILCNAGYRVGTFSSPHFLNVNERIAINHIPISDNELLMALRYLIKQQAGQYGFFKVMTLACHLLFSQQNIDIAIIEVGIGGKYDATNCFEPTVSAITSIGFDHTDILGNTLEEIGYNKAGIFRAHKPALVAGYNIPLSIIEYAATIKAKLLQYNVDFYHTLQQYSWDFHSTNKSYFALPFPGMRGSVQLDNAALAVAISNELMFCQPQLQIGLTHIKTGLLTTTLLGRFQVLPGMNPQIILDVAHNPSAIKVMLHNLQRLPFAKHQCIIFGVMQDKNWQSMVDMLKQNIKTWLLVPLQSSRSADPAMIMQYLLSDRSNLTVKIYSCLTEAADTAFALTTDRIICCGSFLVVSELYEYNRTKT